MSLAGRSWRVVNIRLDDAEELSLEAIDGFVEAGEGIRIEAEERQQLYGRVERVQVGRSIPSRAGRRGAWCGATSWR
jgi:hypothetical protein